MERTSRVCQNKLEALNSVGDYVKKFANCKVERDGAMPKAMTRNMTITLNMLSAFKND
jgi:hypothetical protein